MERTVHRKSNSVGECFTFWPRFYELAACGGVARTSFRLHSASMFLNICPIRYVRRGMRKKKTNDEDHATSFTWFSSTRNIYASYESGSKYDKEHRVWFIQQSRQPRDRNLYFPGHFPPSHPRTIHARSLLHNTRAGSRVRWPIRDVQFSKRPLVLRILDDLLCIHSYDHCTGI